MRIIALIRLLLPIPILEMEICLRFIILLLSSASKTRITFYGGVHEIGGNKFLVEDKGTKIFLDFGMQTSKVNRYFAEFVNPRTCI
jgi:predicted metal-dependent RNase